MEWLKKYAKEITAVVSVLAALITMTAYIIGSIHGVENRMITRMDTKFNQVDVRMCQLERDVAIIKTVLLMKNMMPSELAMNEEK
jgi:hypothetical protein